MINACLFSTYDDNYLSKTVFDYKKEMKRFKERLRFIINDEENIINENEIIVENNDILDEINHVNEEELLEKNKTNNFRHIYNNIQSNDDDLYINEESVDDVRVKSMKVLPLTTYFFK